MFPDDSKDRIDCLADMTIEKLISAGMNLDYVIEIVSKIYTASKLDWRFEDIESRVFSIHRENIAVNLNPKLTMQEKVERWLRSNTSNKGCYSDVTCSLLVCYSDLGLNSPNDKTACRMAFRRLVEKGKLEPVRNRSGVYRYLNGNMTEIDYINADTTPFNIKYPLGVHELVETYKKSLVVVAGEPNAGKTAFLLNLAWKNKSLNPNYFSTDMGGPELNIRLNKFGHPLQDWKSVRFFEKSGDFKDVVDPNGLNIIDYLEVSKDFFEIGGMLTEIYNKLNDGVAVVAIQKPPGRDTGVGGARTLDKARLYMSIEPGILKIVKGKLWRQDCVNPNGMWCKWTLGGGCNFKVMPDPSTADNWRRSS